MTFPNQLTNPAQANAPVVVNENFAALPGLYAYNYATTSGLTEGGFGGDYGATAVADWTVSLTNATTNYIVAHRTTGAVTTSTATTNWNDTATYGRVRRCVTAGSVVTARIDWRFLEGGIFDRASVSPVADGDKGDITVSGSGATWTIDNDAVTYAKLQNVTATSRVLGRKTGGAGDAEECTLSEVLDFIGSAAQGDVFYRGAAAWERLGAGTSGYFLQTQGAGANPQWAASTGAVATDTIWDAAGDLAVGTGANTAAKLTMGSALQVLRVNAGATALEWAAASGGTGTKTYAVLTPGTAQPPASNFATFDTRNSILVLEFDAATDESTFWNWIVPEGASLGSGLKIEIHWMSDTATSGTCRWGVQIERMNTDLDSDSFDTVATAGGTANGTSGILTVTEITITTIDSIAAGDSFRLKVYRDADGTSGTDDMTGDAQLVAVEVRSAA